MLSPSLSDNKESLSAPLEAVKLSWSEDDFPPLVNPGRHKVSVFLTSDESQTVPSGAKE